jgi:hypothetical protein
MIGNAVLIMDDFVVLASISVKVSLKF